MSKLNKFISVIIFSAFLLASCSGLSSSNNNGSSAEELVATAAYETLQAEAVANNDGSDGDGGEDSDPEATDPAPTDPVPTNTDVPATEEPTEATTPTATPICNMAQLIEDLTIPDDTVMQPGETFTKIWKIKNNGTCTWTAGYQIIFADGDQMGAPITIPMPSVVAPNGTVDISIDMTAPMDEDTFKGDWKLRSADGIEFGLGDGSAFFVQIIVVEPTATLIFIPILPIPVTFIPIFGINVEIINSDAGSVNSGGDVASSALVGDTSTNIGIQSFFKFDLSSIPAGSTINSVFIGATSYTTQGDAFAGLDYLRVYDGSYFPLDAGDYDDYPGIGSLARFGLYAELNGIAGNEAMEEAVENALASGNLELILVFNNTETDNDGNADYIMFDGLSLIINYFAP
jgi:hypothetical protein